MREVIMEVKEESNLMRERVIYYRQCIREES